MLLRLALAVGALGITYGAWRLWRRPPRLSRLDLADLGVAGPAVIQFTSAWCSPCRAAAPHLRRFAEEAAVTFAQVDVGERPEVARRYGIRSVPTIAVADRGGRVVGTWTALPANGEIEAVTRRARSEP